MHHAAFEVASEDQGLELLDRAPDRVGLLENVDAVLVLFDHAAHALEMALDVIQALEGLWFGGRVHRDALSGLTNHPLPR